MPKTRFHCCVIGQLSIIMRLHSYYELSTIDFHSLRLKFQYKGDVRETIGISCIINSLYIFSRHFIVIITHQSFVINTKFNNVVGTYLSSASITKILL